MSELMEQDIDGMANGDYQGIEDTAGELFQQLVMITDGEAKMLVKSVYDGDGYRARGDCTHNIIRGRWLF